VPVGGHGFGAGRGIPDGGSDVMDAYWFGF